jgi:3-methyladenine DNA glycosylase/8-oxoguanine DNA glycosylase
MELHLSARQPFSFRGVADSHGWRQLAPFRGDADSLSYVVRLASGRTIDLYLAEAAGGVRVQTDDAPGDAETAEVGQVVAWMFGLDQDLSSFYAIARSEPKLARAVEAGLGRILRSASLFEDVVKTILTTNTAWGGTKRMVENLVNLFGEPVPANPARRAFPTPASLAAADVETLRQAGRLGYRAPYVLELARGVDSGGLDLEALRTAPLTTAELRARLAAIKGVGPYAVANLLMLLGRYDAIPIDSWALKMVSREWHNAAPIGPAEVEAAFARWGQWRGLAYWFWQWSDEGPTQQQ